MIDLRLHDLMSLSRDASIPDPERVDRILAAARRGDSLPLDDVNLLVNAIRSGDFAAIRRHVLAVSTELRRATFGDQVVPMAPVEASNYCASDCGFCGWRSSNTLMRRLQISEDLIMEQVRYLVGRGIRYIEFVGGDDFGFVRNTLPSLITSTRRLAAELGAPIKICFCTMSLTAAHYRELKELGADSMIVWQETYDPDLYRRQITGGPKARGITDDWQLGADGDGYAFRLGSQERALEAGLEVALGAMLGLGDNLAFEVLATIAHGRALIGRYPVSPRHPIIVGMPTWNRITTPATDNRPPERLPVDPFFSYLAAVYFLSLPRGLAWIFPNCRVGIDTQIEAAAAAGVFTSTEVKLGPGGYLPTILAGRRARGEDTSALERLITFELGEPVASPAGLGRELDLHEQFCHHYHPHDAYVEGMARAGLRIVASPTLTGPMSE